MCDQDHYDDDLKQYQARGAVSRRQFGALSLGAGMNARGAMEVKRLMPGLHCDDSKQPPRIRLCRSASGASSRGSAEGATGVVHLIATMRS